MYDDILLPIDRTEEIDAVVDHAIAIADHMDATLHVLFVADTTRDSVTTVRGEFVDALVQEGNSIVETVGERVDAADISHTKVVIQGNPAQTIVEYADTHDCGLIVVPTHGREGVSRYVLGSVAEKIVRLSSVPVITTRLRADERLTFPYERILVATDGSAAADRAVEHAVDLADATDAALYVLSIVEDSSIGDESASSVSVAESESRAQQAVDAAIEAAATAGVEAFERIEHGNPVAEIQRHIDEDAIDVVVLGTTGRHGLEQILLGSVAQRTVRTASVPVVTVSADES